MNRLMELMMEKDKENTFLRYQVSGMSDTLEEIKLRHQMDLEAVNEQPQARQSDQTFPDKINSDIEKITSFKDEIQELLNTMELNSSQYQMQLGAKDSEINDKQNELEIMQQKIERILLEHETV
jgi:protein required for attachment to host cells